MKKGSFYLDLRQVGLPISLLLLLVLLLPSCSRHITKAFLQANEAEISTALSPSANPCREVMNYAPDAQHPEYTPMRYVRLRFLVVRHDSNDHGFDLPQAKLFVNKLLEEANYKLSLNAPMRLPVGNNTPVLPTNYRYVLYPNPNNPDDEGVTMVYDSSLAYFNKKGGPNGFYDPALFNKYHIQKDSVLNIFLLEHHPDSLKSKTYNVSNDGVGFSTWMKMISQYSTSTQYKQTETGEWYYESSNNMGGLFNHEAGHTLGLMHSWQGDNCPDTPDNPNCWDQNSKACAETGIYSNNMMDYNNQQAAVTPCQIAHIQYNMATEGTTMRKLLLRQWCTYNKDATVTIPNGETAVWKSSREMEGDIVVSNKATLIIQCRISLPKGAKIIVKQKGKLVIDGGEITNICGDEWLGIEVWKSTKEKGKVIVQNGGKATSCSNLLAP